MKVYELFIKVLVHLIQVKYLYAH